MDIVAKIVAIDELLSSHEMPHAFGGALALAWCTQQARGTIDIDLNLFLSSGRVNDVRDVLGTIVEFSDAQFEQLAFDGQVRLYWDQVPVDLFLNTTEFHEQLADRVRYETFAGRSVPFLSCTDLAVFKCLFNRSKDWVDIEEMVAMRSVDVDIVLGVLVRYLGGDDERVERLRTMITQRPIDD
jgi:hypothetical protein